MGNLILDSNLLLLLVVGLTSKAYISRHRRLSSYTEQDYGLLRELLVGCERIVVTPNTLTETSNLLRYVTDPIRTEISLTFRKLVEEADEQHVPSVDAVGQPVFLRLGLTDSVLLRVLEEQVIVTADLDLYLAAVHGGRKALNFHHLRESRGIL